ncbi:M23 family metallopeptidase [Filibacter tadaridae]|uniref:Murein DD-endopeptidase MepM n=1 Tax=Filibacter tadaridae TaxID=2483811 RepID=A0A3P5X0G3_9BACL|nr:M23 family metallopeptidase [Filibacter tadaridae]VDC21687.1 Murein DD-endopeptidase MepM [Filibacter tadaridae]
MSIEKNKQDKRKRTLFGRKAPFGHIQKVFIITVMLVTLGLNVGFANEDKGLELQTVFHVYSNGEYVGKLSDEKKLEQLKEQKLEKANSEFKNLPLMIGTELSVIPERVFMAGTEDEVVLKKLQNIVTVKAEAVGISIDGELALFVNDMTAYNEVIRKLKLQSVNEKELNEFENRTRSTEPIPPLRENETRIANIILSSDIQAVNSEIAPEKVKQVKEAVVLLNKGTLEEKNYTIQPGDVLGSIASAHNMPTEKLLELNPGYSIESILHLGDKLNVTAIEPYVEIEVQYEAKKRVKIEHERLTEKDSSLYKGEKKVTQKGSDGEKIVTKLIRKQDGKVVGQSVQEEKVLVEPTSKVVVVGTKVMSSRGTGSFKWPTVGGYVSSKRGTRWGRIHQGIDIARPSSRTIKASDNGVVITAGRHSTYGNRVIVRHNNGYKTLYAHLASINVHVGQVVPQGTKIGVMGSTGRVTGMHLHFEVFKNGSNINPLDVLR